MAGESWPREPLKNVVENWVIGSTPPRKDPNFFVQEGGVPWAKAEDVTGGVLTETGEQVSLTEDLPMRPVPKGAVLLTTAGTIGRAAIAGREMFCNQAVQALCFREDKILPKYGYYFLLSQRPLLMQLVSGTGQRSIPKGKLETLLVSCPPLPVQENIIQRLGMLETLCEKAEQMERLLARYRLARTLREAERAKGFAPLGELLAEPPRPGLPLKTVENGLPLVNSLNEAGHIVTELSGFGKAMASEKQVERNRLRLGDVLLRGSCAEPASRGAVVGRLPEEALPGGSLTVLRPRPDRISPGWLLAWLLGPGGGPLYVDGKLRRSLLAQYRVPMPESPERLEEMFQWIGELEKKTAQFTQWAQTLFETALRLAFHASSFGRESGAPDILDRLTEPMNLFFQELSPFQQELYRLFLRAGRGRPVRSLFKGMGRPRRAELAGSVQDALSTFTLLEQFGLVEREAPQNISLPSDGGKAPRDPEEFVADYNGQPVRINTYKPTADIFEENAYAAEAGEDTKL